MTLLEMKKRVLALIEELDPASPLLTGDPDIASKINAVTNQIMFELARLRKLPRYLELPVEAGQTLTFADLEKKCGSTVYQIGLITGVGFTPRAGGAAIRIHDTGTAAIDCFVYPERITDTTAAAAYEFELPDDLLEIMPYGIAGDLLKSDVSAGYGQVYSARYESLLRSLDSRYLMSGIRIEGGEALW